jgi:hypothetical protein
MAFINRLESSPTDRNLRIMLFVGLIATLIIYPIMGYFFAQSRYTTNVMASQLCFSGEFLKNSYIELVFFGDLEMYRIAQTLDYVFMASYGLLIFALAVSQARKLKDIRMKTFGFYLGIGGIFAAIFDAIENAFILMTLTDPLNFPDWWAVAHSCFALAKWILLYGAIIWYILAIIMEKRQK